MLSKSEGEQYSWQITNARKLERSGLAPRPVVYSPEQLERFSYVLCTTQKLYDDALRQRTGARGSIEQEMPTAKGPKTNPPISINFSYDPTFSQSAFRFSWQYYPTREGFMEEMIETDELMLAVPRVTVSAYSLENVLGFIGNPDANIAKKIKVFTHTVSDEAIGNLIVISLASFDAHELMDQPGLQKEV
ncbi:MAG TPA: hypothetical protein VLF68_00185 [Candidatus Saccharimonadales bacterium]|nr:hypothetical protein [Candidatus Saccharimonadales bacterium]